MKKQRLLNYISKMPHFDKALHLVAGFMITLFCHCIFKMDIWVSFGIGMSAGLLKEMVWDYFTGGKVEWLDWIATILGSLIAVWILI
jgi:VanZ family protein